MQTNVAALQQEQARQRKENELARKNEENEIDRRDLAYVNSTKLQPSQSLAATFQK